MNLHRYKREIKSIKEYAIKNDVPEYEVDKIFEECFQLLESKTSSKLSVILKFCKFFSIICFIAVFSILILYNHPKTHNVLLRNLQSFIYPGLRVFRKIAVPIITVYPSLTDWYDEWCLVENPYFQVNEMDCWPCNSVNSVQNLTGYNITTTFNPGIPFARLEKMEKIDMNKLFEIYIENQNIFDKNAETVISNNGFYRTINDVMYKKPNQDAFSNENVHVTWRINRMEPGRELRKLFPKLPGIPDWWSLSTEKFIFMDERKAAAYKLPNPECANIILQCNNGERLIELHPSPECTQNCRKLSVLLTAQHSLWYNWWYWRPISLPSDNTTTTTIMYLTSYC